MINLQNASKQSVLEAIQRELSLSIDDASIFLHYLSQIDSSKNVFDIEEISSEPPPGFMGFMVTTKKYNINVSSLSLGILSFLLGLTPVGAIASFSDLISSLSDAVLELSSLEVLVIKMLREISNNGEEDISIKSLYATFLRKDDEHNSKPQFESENDLDILLNSLADKQLIEIRMSYIKIIK